MWHEGYISPNHISRVLCHEGGHSVCCDVGLPVDIPCNMTKASHNNIGISLGNKSATFSLSHVWIHLTTMAKSPSLMSRSIYP